MSRSGMERRQLLKLAGGALVGGALARTFVADSGPALAHLGATTTTLTWRRRDDFVELTFSLHNIAISPDGRTLTRADAAQRSYLVVVFPPQAIAEATSDEPAGDESGNLPTLPVPARLARSSRLAFDVTDDLPFDLTVEKLLGWNGWTPSLVPNALGRPGFHCVQPDLRAPTETETSLELPYKLQLSPHAGGGWAHRATPLTGPTGWTELWHTRLGVRDQHGGVDENNADDRIVRAVWARYAGFADWLTTPTSVPAIGAAGPGDPTGLAMDAHSRYEIVRLSSDVTLPPSFSFPRCRSGTRRNRREPINVSLLALSSLGGWLTSTATWAPISDQTLGIGLESWQHRATMGRDHYVRLVRPGFLFPFGHRAAYVELSERKLLGGTGGASRVAYLRKRVFLIIRQPERSYAGQAAMEFGGRGMPFTVLRVLTDTTPNLLAADNPASLLPGVGAGIAFVPRVDTTGTPLMKFSLRGTDHSGRGVDFEAPAVFVFGTPAADVVTTIINGYAGAADLRTGAFGGARTAVAPPGSPGDTSVVVDTAQFVGGAAQGAVAAGEAPFFPRVDRFVVDLPEARALAGAGAAPSTFGYFPGYLAGGFTGNPGEVFLAVPPTVTGSALGFAGDRSGGVANPNMAIGGLSRTLGPLAGGADEMVQAAKQEFDPSKMFDTAAKLLGDITLADVLAALVPGTPNPGQAVELVTRDLGGGKVETRLRWRPKLKSFAILEVTDASALELRARVVAEPGKPPFYEVNGALTEVSLLFFKGVGEFIRVRVKSLRFTDSTGAKPDVQVAIGDVDFLGPLAFVKELAKLLDFGNGSGVSIVPAADRIAVALDLALPSLSVGILALENLSVHVGLTVPFNATPVVLNTAISTRDHPFTVGVGIFRGGGFVGLALTARGLDMIEFSFEFGAGLSLNLGVASGTVEAAAGIYFKLSHVEGGTPDQQTIELTAFIRLRGALSVLGIITVTLEFYLSLSYMSNPDRLTGQATLTVSIEVFLFSMSVSVTCRRELARGGGLAALTGAGGTGGGETAVRFGDVFPRPAWESYCASFAPLG